MRFSKVLFVLLAASSAFLVLGLSGCGKQADYKQMTMTEAQQWMAENGDYILLDVRTPEEYAAGYIPGAINLPVETIGEQPVEALPNKEQTILVYCRSGNRSKKAAGKLVQQGYTAIIEIGGIQDWPGELTLPPQA